MKRDSLLLPAALLLVAVVVPAAGATPAASPRVVSTAKAPLVAAQGDRIAVKATVRGTGKRATIALVLGTASGPPIPLGRGSTVSHKGLKRIVVRGVVPKTVVPGVLHTLLVCVKPGACRKAAQIATSGTSTEERIAGARLAGRISATNAIVFGLRALRPDKRLPPELRGDANGPSGEEAPIQDAVNAFGSLPAPVQKQVFPFFVPPRGKGSAWAPPGRRKHSSATSAVDCRFYENLDPGANGWDWRGVPTSDNHAIVWYIVRTDPRWKDIEAQERAAAHRYARELPKIWTKLTGQFKAPESDAGETCYHGPDGRLDVYVDDFVTWAAGNFSRSALAVTVPYPRAGNPCTNRPAWMSIKGNLPNWALAHEFMHAIQFAYPYANCNPDPKWWNEGEATWAADFVYPDDQYEQREYPQLVTEPLGYEVSSSSYASWPFWMMLQRTLGTGVLRTIFANLRTKSAVDAVDSAIPGGFARQLPRFFLHAYNQSPVGDAGFEITKSFKAWDKWSATPDVPAPTVINLGAQTELTVPLKSANMTFPPRSLAGYQRITIPDKKVKQLKFTNDLNGRAGAHVDALLHLADGKWKLADWTQRKDVTLCRDKPDENVTEIVVVNTNTGKSGLARFSHTLRARQSCGPHYYRIQKATLSETWTGTSPALYPGCPDFSGVQTNTMTLTNVFGPGNNQLFEFPAGMVGQLGAIGMKSTSTTMHGCDYTTTPVACTLTSSDPISGQVMINVNVPTGSPTAQVHWSLDDPFINLHGGTPNPYCTYNVIGWTLDNETVGDRTVPADVFEADTPQTISISASFDLTDPVGAQVHATENYSLTLQRVNADGSPL